MPSTLVWSSSAMRASTSIRRILFGRLLANRESAERRIGAFEGVPAMGLDGLGSSAYGPEAALAILMPVGALGLVALGPIMIAIVGLLAILYISYRQTIAAYPSNGGAYTVSRENLGQNASLLAAAALMIDYVLNVAVGISAGVAALVSAVPALHPHILPLCIGILAFITLINLRGTLDAGRLFALPTYLFTASFVSIIAIGVWKVVNAGGDPVPVVPPPPLSQPVETLSVWLILRAFSNGCTAMTGVEAVSNGVGAFKEPPVRHAHRTLTVIVLILGTLLAGIAYLAHAYAIGAMDQTRDGYQSVLSQLAGAVVGRGVFYYIAIGSLLCVLAFSANTSFTDFPRLCRTVAEDGFLPRPFAMVGRRLVYSIGIIYLAFSAGLLLFLFGGITDRLIPLFAIGAFLTFTLSQSGMVLHWLRELRSGAGSGGRHTAHVKLVINGIGAAATGIALVIIIVSKFGEGAWITLVVIPVVILLLKSISRYYDNVARQLREAGPLRLLKAKPPIVLVATEDWSRLTDKALGVAVRFSPDVIAVHLTAVAGPDAGENERKLRDQWVADVERPAQQAGLPPPRLMFLQSSYRRLHSPMLKLIEKITQANTDRLVAVLVPELVKQTWWQYLLHTQRARRLSSAILRYGGSNVVVIRVPWHLEEPQVQEALEPEEIPSSPQESPSSLGRERSERSAA